ncbi:hypothetical protein FRX31_013526 [Thalictrum thalictroides]|uniref:Uncharacterized protein n=1 Tax=Thalictrum thalictroides TaxID=46969 RepID=A0A7J6WHG8_THATH|nr:hypothetical protein FRX31_013526 [Thalictrum thalictroides]
MSLVVSQLSNGNRCAGLLKVREVPSAESRLKLYRLTGCLPVLNYLLQHDVLAVASLSEQIEE